LNGVRLKASPEDGGMVRLSAFDYEVSAKAGAAADVEDGGDVLVSGKLLADIAKLLPAKPATFRLDGAKVVLSCGASTFTLSTMPLDDYPALPAPPPPVGAIGANALAHAVGQVAVAATRDETLPLLTGVKMEIEGENLTLLATDRYRLAIKELTWRPASPDVSRVALVRAKTLADAARSFGHTEEVAVSLTSPGIGDIIGFAAGGRETTSLLIDGDYPQVRNLLPASFETVASVGVQDLTEAVRRVSLVAERNTPVQIALAEGQATLNAGAGDDAQASEVIPATIEGPETTVAFNPHFLLEGLNAIDAPEVRISLNATTKPVLFQGENEGSPVLDYKYLLVPIRFAV
jgi:DNA polymerase-3 subunit beta